MALSKIIIRLLRPRHWIKNLFIIAPLIFSNSFTDQANIYRSVLAVAIFSFIASGVYIINDIADISYDRLHTIKKNRPLARGDISISKALAIAFFIVVLSLYAAFIFSFEFFVLSLGYILINILYTFWFKKVFLIDMFFVSLGFVIRVLIGIVVINAFISPWIIVETFFLAYFLVSSKRLMELRLLEHDAVAKHLRSPVYTEPFLEQVVFSSAIFTSVIYMLYAVEIKSPIFIITFLPVIYGLFRFFWLVQGRVTALSNPTDIIFEDKHLQFTVLIFVISVIIILSLF
jgi:4-hydroxybenzoate polyprenyltransferase